MKKIKKNRGITLVNLVITIIIIIILATVAINFAFGNNGLINRAEQAKLQQEIATVRETLTMVLGDAFIEKKLNPEYDQNEFLDKFIKSREPNVYLEEEAIGLDGHVFELDRSVPELGKYQGEITGPRIKEIKVIEETTNSASIEVVAINAEEATYEYWYKNEAEGQEQWEKVETDKNSNTCTISGLTQGEIYNIKVIITTKEGSTEGTTNIQLGEMPKGAVTFTPVEWVGDGTATTTINTSETGYTLQYQIVEGEEQTEDTAWKTATTGQTIEGLHHNETVYGRLWDGTNAGSEASVNIKDKTSPTISSFTATNVTYNSITIQVNASDLESGIESYTYTINGENEESNTTGSHTFTGLNAGTSYILKALVIDKAKNTIENTIIINTISYPIIQEKLKSGNYVYYTDATGVIRKCIVLWDSSSSYGIEIITNDTVENITLSGKDDYNDTITTLNLRAGLYNNQIYSGSARSVGSIPNNPNSQPEINAYGLRTTDNNYEADYNQMRALGILTSNNSYWLASHYQYSSSTYRLYRIRFINGNSLDLCSLYRTNTSGNSFIFSGTYGLRVVFHLKSDIKVTGGNGTSDNPYTLGT